MKKIEFIVTKEAGIHAVPASILAKRSQSYKADIVLYRGEEKADMKNIFEIMRMGIKKDTRVRIEIDGEDEIIATNEIKELVKAL